MKSMCLILLSMSPISLRNFARHCGTPTFFRKGFFGDFDNEKKLLEVLDGGVSGFRSCERYSSSREDNIQLSIKQLLNQYWCTYLGFPLLNFSYSAQQWGFDSSTSLEILFNQIMNEVQSVVTGSADGVSDTAALLQKFQRDINRMSDADRMTRKRGLQKLLDDLPWKSNKQKKALGYLVKGHILIPLIDGISDPVEKCRELCISLLSSSLMILQSGSLDAEIMLKMIRSLCDRINDLPFKETSEELRLQLLELLKTILRHPLFNSSFASNSAEVADMVLTTMTKAALDTFPAAKRSCAEIICVIAEILPISVRMNFKSLLKSLIGNATHQHSKTRSATLQAIGIGLSCVTDEYEHLMADPVLQILSRTVADRAASTRNELVLLCTNLLSRRIQSLGRRAIEDALSLTFKNHQASVLKYGDSDDFSKWTIARGGAVSTITGELRENSVSADLQLVSLLLLLQGDEAEEVVLAAKEGLEQVARSWALSAPTHDPNATPQGMNTDIVDGELELSRMASSAAIDSSEAMAVDAHDQELNSNQALDQSAECRDYVGSFLRAYLYPVMRIITAGVGEWTTDSRRRNLKGLEVLINLSGGDGEGSLALGSLLPQLLSCLSGPVRDEDASVRTAAEDCCLALGTRTHSTEILDLLIPRVRGEIPGGDTFSQRTSALRLLTHVMQGFPSNEETRAKSTAERLGILETISCILTDPKLYEFREPALREAVLLLVRAVIDAHHTTSSDSTPCGGSNCAVGAGVGAGSGVEGHVVLSLVFLQALCPGEADVVPEMARREMEKMASGVCAAAAVMAGKERERVGVTAEVLVGRHFDAILGVIIRSSSSASARDPSSDTGAKCNSSSSSSSNRHLPSPSPSTPLSTPGSVEWTPSEPLKACFEVLVRCSPSGAWRAQAAVFDIIIPQLQPKKTIEPGSAEANMITYAAVRGEELLPSNGEVDVRLSLLALLEGLIRAGASDWQCGSSIALAAKRVLSCAVVPNLVWRVGRVEATVRKVALAACYGLLKAGAVETKALMAAAPHLVPLLTSNLDDFDESARVMACLCLTISFERLRGSFGSQAIHELYPKLLKRLDDSSDSVREAVCATLEMFLCCAPKQHYSGTTLDYTLDQLFVHLDDPLAAMQTAVLKAILIASKLDPPLVVKKAHLNRLSQRTPEFCDKILYEVEGFEILPDEN